MPGIPRMAKKLNKVAWAILGKPMAQRNPTNKQKNMIRIQNQQNSVAR